MAQTRQELRQKNKAARRRLRRRRMVVLLVLVILLLIGAVFFLRLERWQIKTIVVRGNKVLSTSELSAAVERALVGDYWHLIPRRQRWFYPAVASQAALLAEFPRLSTALGYVKDDELVIQVKEHSPSAIWCPSSDQTRDKSSEQCYFVNNQAVTFSPVPQFSRPIYLTIEFEAGLSTIPSPAPFKAETLAKLLAFQGEFQTLFNDYWPQAVNIFQVVHGVDDDYNFWVESVVGNKQFQVLVNLEQDPTVILETMKTILASGTLSEELADYRFGLEYIDLRFVPKVFYRIIK